MEIKTNVWDFHTLIVVYGLQIRQTACVLHILYNMCNLHSYIVINIEIYMVHVKKYVHLQIIK